MRVLLTNDDGILAPGLAALERAALALGAEVFVVAPDGERSAASHAITIRRPLFLTDHPVGPAALRVAVSGTPCDCVRLALIKLLADAPPDLCLSGVNHGANLGWDVFFSGTVSAAAEAASFGVPSIALSLCTWEPVDFSGVDEVAKDLIARLLAASKDRPGFLYNVNVPAVPRERIQGVRLTHQEPSVKGDNFEERSSPLGQRYFWPMWEQKSRPPHLDDVRYDRGAVAKGYVSVTPLRYEVHDLDIDGLALDG